MALRRMMWALLVILVLGHLGLYLAVIDFSRSHERQSARLATLEGQWANMKKEIAATRQLLAGNEGKMAVLSQLEYKYNLFCKRYPDFAKIIDVVCQKSPQYGFHPDLIMGIIQTESDFNPFSFSFRGAYGLMQIHYWVWKDELKINKDKIFDIAYNIDLGLKILNQYVHETTGDVRQALMLYNNGYTYANLYYPDKVSKTAFCLNQKLDSLVTYSD